ncbi:MAG: hypothetical protein ABI767_13840 [Rhodanobacter sp.]
MTNSRIVRRRRTTNGFFVGLLVLAFAGSASAWQSTPPPPPPPPIKPAKPVLVLPPSNLRFQQVVQQQKVRDQLQQSQLEQQLHRGVASNARLPAATYPNLQQDDQAEQAQLERDRARQQDLLDQYRQTPVLPRVVPKDLPKPDQDSGDR